jgi:hypothetical protein
VPASLDISPATTNVPSAAAAGLAIGVAANVSWTAATNASWLAVTGGTPGSGNGTVTFNVATNAGTMARTGGVVVAGGGITKTCVVVQAGTPVGNLVLAIQSDYGVSTPPVGVSTQIAGVGLTMSVTSPDTRGSTQYICTGWAMTGNSPTGGTAANFAMTITNSATLTWLWTTNYWLNATTAGGGIVAPTGAWCTAGSTVGAVATPSPGYRFSGWTGAVPVVQTNQQSISLLMDRSRAVSATFTLTNLLHTVVAVSSPSGVTTVAGSGTYSNGQTTVFSSLHAATNGGTRYDFLDFQLNGAFVTVSNPWSMAWTAADPASATVTARYASSPLRPIVLAMTNTPGSPVPLTTNFLVTVRFDRTMSRTMEPSVSLSNTLGGSITLLPTNGQWLTTVLVDDTYRTRAMSITNGMDGTYSARVGGAIDTFGQAITTTNPLVVTIDAEAPGSVPVVEQSKDRISVTLSWAGYSVPGDLAGFRIYSATNSFTTVAGLDSLATVVATTRVYRMTGLAVGRIYHVGVTAYDMAGNASLASTSIAVQVLSSDFPPSTPSVMPIASPTSVRSQLLRGGKDAGTSVHINGALAVALDGTTNWQHEVFLAPGTNNYSLHGVDDLGFASGSTNISIVFADAVPGPVTVFANGDGNGQTVNLSWTNYNETTNGGDIAGYRVYRLTAAFTNVSDAILDQTVAAGVKICSSTGLARNTTYWFATVAYDAGSNALTQVFNVTNATTRDVVPPPDPQGLFFLCGTNSLTLSWTSAVNPDVDTLGHRVFVTNNPVGVFTTNSSYTLGGIAAGTSYAFRVAAEDASSNRSTGVTILGTPLLPNPTGLQGVAGNMRVDLVWTSTIPAPLVQGYAVYVSSAAFTNVSNMTPWVVVATNRGTVAGLTNGATYHFAVATLNLSGCINPTVASISIAPAPDLQGPIFQTVTFRDQSLVDGAILRESGDFKATLDDRSGLARVEFWLDGVLRYSEVAPAESATWPWAVCSETEGGHQLLLKAQDRLGNLSQHTNVFTLALGVPTNTPVFSSPTNGARLNTANIQLTGSFAGCATGVQMVVNGVMQPTAMQIVSGVFRGTQALSSGTNELRARAVTGGGAGPLSPPLLVYVDISIPPTPTQLDAQTRSEGAVRISWAPITGGRAAGYNLYRSTQSFENVGQALRVNSALLGSELYVDLPPTDGTYFYRVASVNEVGTESALSEESGARSDSVGPRILSVTYETTGPSVSHRFACGTVTVTFVVSEDLASVPFVSLARTNGNPITLTPAKTTGTQYRAQFTITPGMGSTMAYLLFSGRDQAGNRGTDVDEGESIFIDTLGPPGTISAIPASPIKNNPANPTNIAVSLMFGAQDIPSAAPILRYALSVSHPSAVAVSLSQLSATVWQGNIALGANAGQSNEWLILTMESADALGNVGTNLSGGSRLQIYQGTLMPLDAPSGLTARALSGGRVYLQWQPVNEAVNYALYRQASGQPSLSWLANTGGGIAWTDVVANGTATYAVASVRMANSQVVTGAMSAAVNVVVDGTAPPPPFGLSLQVQGGGVFASWNQPTGVTESLTYALYRSPQPIVSATGLQPVAFAMLGTNAVDPQPLQGTMYYSVTARDALTNESVPSANVYTNLGLLPPRTLEVEWIAGGNPVIGWSHGNPSSIDGYAFFLGSSSQALARLNVSPWATSTTNYVDTGFGGTTRWYGVSAVDVVGPQEVLTPVREIMLPAVTLDADTNTPLRRGVMNRLVYTVCNNSGMAIPRARMDAQVGGLHHWSDEFSLASGTSRVVAVAVGGYSNLPFTVQATNRLVLTPRAGDEVRMVSTMRLDVVDDQMAALILPETFVRGAAGTVRFQIVNTCSEEIEIVLARNFGNSASDQVRFHLRDADGMEYGVAPVQQATGTSVVTLENGVSVLRLGPGEAFTSLPTSVPVPQGAPDRVVLMFEVDSVHHHYGRDNQVSLPGFRSSISISLAETAYYAEVTNITPAVAYGPSNIMISGRALFRDTALPVSLQAVRLVISVQGFDRTYDLKTDTSGNWSMTFEPMPTEWGTYTVSATHPDIIDRSVQGTFAIHRVALSPAYGQIRCPRNYDVPVTITVSPSSGLDLSNVRLSYEAPAQPLGELITGVTVVTTQTANITGGQSASVACTIRADASAPDSGRLILRVRSDSPAPGLWGEVPLEFTFLPAVTPEPMLAWSPPYIETGVAISNIDLSQIVLRNDGFGTLLNARVSMVQTNGSPAPSWVILNSASNVGNLAVGASLPIEIMVAPDATVPLTITQPYRFFLRVQADNYPQTDISVWVFVDASGMGDALFKITDIYTGTIDTNGHTIVGLAGARIRMVKESGSPFETNLVTDALGEAQAQDLPVGRYLVRATASGHDSASAQVWIKPGATTVTKLGLQNALVTVEWSVVPTIIQDRYEIVLNITYETEVPAPVVIIDPPSVSLPAMQPGDILNGEYAIRNLGLIRADDVQLHMPPSGDYYRFDLLAEVPDRLDAQQTIRVPYRITCLSVPGTQEQGGGGCWPFFGCTVATYKYTCKDNTTFNRDVTSCFTRFEGDDCGTLVRSPVWSGASGWGLYFQRGGFSGVIPIPSSIFDDPDRDMVTGDACNPKKCPKDDWCCITHLKANYIIKVEKIAERTY